MLQGIYKSSGIYCLQSLHVFIIIPMSLASLTVHYLLKRFDLATCCFWNIWV